MLNLIYSSFPYGNAEAFAEYEIDYLNRTVGSNYRIFSFYKGDKGNIRKNFDIRGEVYTVERSISDYCKALLSLLLPSVMKELLSIRRRSSRDRIAKCIWRVLSYRAYGYAFRDRTKQLGLADHEVYVSYWLTECAYAALMVKRLHKNVVVVSRAHGFDVFAERCYLPFRTELLGGIDAVFPISETGKQYLLAKYNQAASESRIRVHHLGINIPANCCAIDNRQSFRIVSCSSIIQLKRLDLIIEALSEITEFTYKWVHIGDGPLRNQMETLVKSKFTHPNQSHEFIGRVSLAQVHELYHDCGFSLFINCSDTEGIPVSIMEAMSYGIPVVARDSGGNSEIVNNHNGILIQHDCTSSDIANAIRRLFKMEEVDYVAMKRAARMTVENEYSAEEQYSSFFKEIEQYSVK